MNYAFQKDNKFAKQQADKYKSSYDKSMKGPQLQEKDIFLVKIVAHKGRHKLQDKWEPEEYVVVEQPIAGTPVYRVQPVNWGNIRTLHRNLLLPLGVKLEQDDVDPKSESQFSSFMYYHEGESSSMDPSTNEQEFSKSPIEDSTQRHDSGVDNQRVISSHDSDVIAYESNETSSPSFEVSFPDNSVPELEIVTENDSVESTMEDEVVPLRRSARSRKQTQLFDNPWLYKIPCKLTPKVLSDLLHHVPDTMDSLTDRYIDTVEC